ncbi:hypothetical protein EJ05DRAFT_503949 [Pseudovirgaria hyperparasitica]|uniref:ACB domain-containing protein n=1 Tax=Pseudovirgaria hyperparasitica TaxID=470096 RepID=A0A6A6VW00_9PEZI|nr:uncharacterized protein EJ05DRAFT_503949 [Pseudovirgaria hyperparasitica]KAF2754413.1 hypothetical protein EJ05DRAFT_503949 [Pseudovirgaria hyperparasitica]
MSDSVDRVFSHALNTVNKIRTGSEKPPASVRLKLYGLYKQSMEGDVEGIQERPEGQGEEVHRAREKWDAWKSQQSLTRTEAKRRYITTLIETMNRYASPSPDARELVAELEFVWDQVKSNVPSSSSSSPLQTIGGGSYPVNLGFSQDSRQFRDSPPRDYEDTNTDAPMKVLSPLSQSEVDEVEEAADEEFVDAQDSRYDVQDGRDSERNADKEVRPLPTPSPDKKWRKSVEQALVKMTAEVAALREQLQSRRIFGVRRQHSFLGWFTWITWTGLKIVAVDAIILFVVLIWMRRKKDRRLENAIRVLLGDAAIQVKKSSAQMGANIGKIALPKLPAKN